MPLTLFESNSKKDREERPTIVPGIVINNCDLPVQGKVLVRLPTVGEQRLARVVAPGAGSSRGIMYIPEPGDEVLVSLEDPADLYIFGNLWNTFDRPPALLPTDVLTKKVIKTGISKLPGHEMAFDDVKQSVTIKTSIGQIIQMAPTGVNIVSGANIINMTFPPAPPAIQIFVGQNTFINMSPTDVTIKAPTINLQADTAVNIVGAGAVTINGGLVKIN